MRFDWVGLLGCLAVIGGGATLLGTPPLLAGGAAVLMFIIWSWEAKT